MAKKIPDKVLLDKLKLYYDTYGVAPKYDDFKQCEWLPNFCTYVRRFESMDMARKLVGIPKPKSKPTKEPEYTRDELIFLLQKYYKEIGYPTIRGIKKCDFMPSDYPFYREFGDLKNALICASIDTTGKEHYFGRYKYTKKELLNLLKEFIENWLFINEYMPTFADLTRDETMPVPKVYIDNFGSVKNAYKEIGYNYKDYNNRVYEQKMLEHYKFLAKELNKTPTSTDIEEYSRGHNGIYSYSTYSSHFDNLYNVAKLCSLKPNGATRTTNSTEKENIQRLIDFKKGLGRVPIQADMHGNDKVCSVTYYARVFGTWTKCLQELFPDYYEEKSFSKIYYSNNGTKCLSKIELYFCNMLEEYSISYDKELYYKDYIRGLKNNYRFDFCIYDQNDNIIFIEIFGIHNKKYKELIKTKIGLCKNNNLPLIDVYYKDIYINYKEGYKSSTQLYSLLQEKLSQLDIDINDIQKN